MIHYPRTELAEALAAALQGKTIFSDAHNGLFLAAPRRTGKSTFLQSDLKPTLERQGVVVIYVDLWADLRRDPGMLITEAIGRTLQARLGKLAKTVKSAGLESVSIAGVKLDTTRIGRQDGATLPDALRALHETTQAPVALIIDEAQQALTSEAGDTTMAALKSARDQINRPGEIHLMLVMSGSDRDKLLRLVNTNGAPFYGSQIQRMPELDQGFIDYLAHLIEAQRSNLAPVDEVKLFDAFQAFGCRPQFFMEALGQALSPLSGLTIRFEQAVLEAAAQRRADDEAQMESEYLGLKPLERAILWRLLEQGPRFRPYDVEALRFYREKTGVKVTAQKAQNALEALRQRTPALVWKSARGEYAVDDAAMHRWFEKRVEDGRWPPQGTPGDLDLVTEEDPF
ncbi:ATP-binding protein [Allochromatium palmeri]|uniref:ATP-binding protein n=1 Tax=Allochromatium palmeri TaxID=231048 RepID=A0A6N8E7W8_9GAMM|nr:ATP-binding protein [Allochromatium palmeri]MTW19671.1 ATP-binding protein [Allochromatium palmeri]